MTNTDTVVQVMYTVRVHSGWKLAQQSNTPDPSSTSDMEKMKTCGILNKREAIHAASTSKCACLELHCWLVNGWQMAT